MIVRRPHSGAAGQGSAITLGANACAVGPSGPAVIGLHMQCPQAIARDLQHLVVVSRHALEVADWELSPPQRSASVGRFTRSSHCCGFASVVSLAMDGRPEAVCVARHQRRGEFAGFVVEPHIEGGLPPQQQRQQSVRAPTLLVLPIGPRNPHEPPPLSWLKPDGSSLDMGCSGGARIFRCILAPGRGPGGRVLRRSQSQGQIKGPCQRVQSGVLELLKK